MTLELRNEITAALFEHDLVKPDDPLDFNEIPAGVSSEIWLVTSPLQSFVVKRPLSILRVATEWHAPLERGYFEYLWLIEARRLLGAHVPDVLAYDAQRRFLIMSYFDQQHYRTLKQLYFAGNIRTETAASIGAALAKLHSEFAADEEIKAKFGARQSLYATRVDPYFDATALRHPDIASAIHQLADQLLQSDVTVIHGDISPKNILVGPIVPVLLDAECACVGDPSFDTGFFLTHLFLKCLVRPDCAADFLGSAKQFFKAYMQDADPTIAAVAGKNTGSYLGVFLLARVDGKSRVEYLNDEAEIQFVREFSRELIQQKGGAVPEIIDRWALAIRTRTS